MARAPDKRICQAESMYLGGMKLVEIANQLNLPEGTVRRWKSTYKWGSERSEYKSERSEKKANVRNTKDRDVAAEVNQVMGNPNLTDKQRLFCLHYVRCFNATKAYQKAYGCSYETAMTEGWNSLRNPKIRDEIQRLKQNRLNREMLDESDIFQKYMDIAFTDIKDFAEVAGGMIRVKGDFDGTLVSEISDTAHGIKIKLSDRMKAMQWISDHMDLATEKQRAEIALIRAKAHLDEPDEVEDDGFLEALAGTAAEDWADEESNI